MVPQDCPTLHYGGILLGGKLTGEIMTSIAVWGMLWYVCYWLYQKRIFFKI